MLPPDPDSGVEFAVEVPLDEEVSLAAGDATVLEEFVEGATHVEIDEGYSVVRAAAPVAAGELSDSEDFSESLALMGINYDARRSYVVWLDCPVLGTSGFTTRMIPTVTTKPAATASVLSSNLFLYFGSRSIDNTVIPPWG